jgi:hypothetical protein
LNNVGTLLKKYQESKMAIEIERIEAPSIDDFYENYLLLDKPVVITGLVNKWPAFNKWTIDYLVNNIGDRVVPITTIIDGDYCQTTHSDMKLSEYIYYLQSGQRKREKLYLAELPVTKYFKDLSNEMIIPDYFDKKERSPKSFIYVGKDNFSQLHFHEYGSAVNCMLYGEKSFRLYPPSETRYLYKYPWHSKLKNMSKTTSLTPDPNEFPEFYKAKHYEVVLKAGEMLFIPIFWWHAIQNNAINIATVTFWGRSSWHRYPPPGMRLDFYYVLIKELPDLLKTIPERIINKFNKFMLKSSKENSAT